MTLENIITIIFENIPLLGIFFLVAGLIKVFTYYKLFGVYIFEFIDIKEVLTLIINNILAYFAILVAFSILFISNTYLNGILSYLTPLSFTVFSLLYFYLRKRVFLYEIALHNLIFWIFFISVSKIHSEAINPPTNTSQFKTQVLVIFLLTLTLYSLINAFSEYYKVKYKHYYSKTKLQIEDIEIISTLDKYYIGKTEKFIFIHNNLEKSNEIIPVSLVKKITFYKA